MNDKKNSLKVRIQSFLKQFAVFGAVVILLGACDRKKEEKKDQPAQGAPAAAGGGPSPSSAAAATAAPTPADEPNKLGPEDGFVQDGRSLPSVPCVPDEDFPEYACGNAKIDFNTEDVSVKKGDFVQHRSVGLLSSTGKFDFTMSVLSLDAPDRPSYLKKRIRYEGTCRFIGSAKNYQLLLRSVRLFNPDGTPGKMLAYMPGGLQPLQPDQNSFEGNLLRSICADFRKDPSSQPPVEF